MADFKHFHRKYKSPQVDEIQILNFDCFLYFLCFSDVPLYSDDSKGLVTTQSDTPNF